MLSDLAVQHLLAPKNFGLVLPIELGIALFGGSNVVELGMDYALISEEQEARVRCARQILGPVRELLDGDRHHPLAAAYIAAAEKLLLTKKEPTP